MSTGEATDAAKRKFAHQHPDWVDGHPPPKPSPKHHVAPTTQTHHYVVKVCNLTGLEAICEHDGRKAVEEDEAPKAKEVPQTTGRETKEPTDAKAHAGAREHTEIQEGMFVLSVLPHDDSSFTRSTVTHSQKSVGYQGSDPFHTSDHEKIREAEAHEETEKKILEKELDSLHEQKANLKATGAHLKEEQATIDKFERKLEQRKQDLTQKIAQAHVNGNLGHTKAQKLHQQRLKLQHDQAAHNQRKAQSSQEVAAHAHREAQNANKLSQFHEQNAAHVRFNLQTYTDTGPVAEVDVVTLKAAMSQHCSAHPIWKVFDGENHKLLASHNGMSLQCNSLLPPVVNETVLSRIVPHLPGQTKDAYWLRNIQPHSYKVQLHTCHATKEILIHVYPQIKSGLALTVNRAKGKMAAPDDSWLGRIEKYEAKFKKLFDILKEWAPRVENLEVDILAQGKLDLSNTWEEEKKTNEVVWKASVDADLDLIEASFRMAIVNINPLPAAMKKRIGDYVDAGIYFTFDGKMAVGFAGAWTVAEGFRMENSKIGGTFALGLEGLVSIGKNGDWGRLEATGTSTIFVGAEVTTEGKALSLALFWRFVHGFTADFALFGPFDVELYHWEHDIWGAGGHNELPHLHLFDAA